MAIMKQFVLLGVLFSLCFQVQAQNQPVVQWIPFDHLDDSLAVKPKKVFIDFVADWCTYCRKMDKVVFTNPEVVSTLNSEYYAVKMNAETTDTVQFDGQLFINDQVGKTRNPVHQLAQVLALREGKFVAPTMLVLDESFAIKQRYFQYMDSEQLLRALE